MLVGALDFPHDVSTTQSAVYQAMTTATDITFCWPTDSVVEADGRFSGSLAVSKAGFLSVSAGRVRWLCVVIGMILCCTCNSLASLSKSIVIPSDRTAFLSHSSSEIEPWFAAGVTNNDRSPDFLRRLREASAGGNVCIEGYLGMLLVDGDGVPRDISEGTRLLRSSAKN